MPSSPETKKASPIARVRALLRAVRHAPDRIRHPRRRRDAAAAIGRWNLRAVLFVCHGNVCRSPFAAAAFERALPESLRSRMRVRSVGFIGPNRGAPAPAIAAASRVGIDLAEHRSMLVTRDIVSDSDLVVVMSPEQAAAVRSGFSSDALVLVLGDLDPEPIATRTIRDPWGCEDAVFDESYARIERCVRELARIVARAGGG